MHAERESTSVNLPPVPTRVHQSPPVLGYTTRSMPPSTKRSTINANELSAYELQRLSNIQKNEAMLDDLGLNSALGPKKHKATITPKTKTNGKSVFKQSRRLKEVRDEVRARPAPI